MTRVAGAVLAAGAGARMGQPKATLQLGGQRLVDRAVSALRAAGCGPVIAVVRDGVDVTDAVVVVNDDPERGMRSSLQLALDAVEADRDAHADADALAIVLVDTPGIGADAVRRVSAAWRPGRIAVARYGERRGHPTVMSPALWRRALTLAGPDEGARALLRTRRDLVDEVVVAGDPTDLDTPADLATWYTTRGN